MTLSPPLAEVTVGKKEWLLKFAYPQLGHLDQLRSLTAHRDLLLPSTHNWSKPISENAFNLALRRLGFGADEMTAHGFGATASTLE
jgi:hypothetical protein